MKSEVLVAVFSKMVDEKLSGLPGHSHGPRGFRGPRGKDFDIQEHAETIRGWVKEFSLKFSDFSDEEIARLRGPRGQKGIDGKDGVNFVFEECRPDIESIIRNEISNNHEKLALKFSDLTSDDISKLRGPRGQDGRSGRDFLWDDHVDGITTIVTTHVSTLADKLKLKFSDLTDQEISLLTGPRGRDGKDGRSFDFEIEC